jgi:hypothetical protein
MALTLVEEQKLEGAGLVTYLGTHQAHWLATLKGTHGFLKASLPSGTQIRPDDVATSMLLLVQTDEDLQAYLVGKGLKQQFWFKYFTNLIIDKFWSQI